MNPANYGAPNEATLSVRGSVEEDVQALVEDYMARLQAGEAPDRTDYILAHPALAGRLEQRLEAVEWLHRLARDQRTSTGDSAPAVSRPTTTPGQLGRYRIEGTLGVGASAVVYRAYDPKFQRAVALKVIRWDEPAGSDAVLRFERDARIAAQLRHPNIVPLHDTGEHDGLRYIDMALVLGETLEGRLQRSGGRPLPHREAAELVYKIASALDYAHEAGIVHRDIKPSNILIDERGEPQLTDFGLARGAGGEDSLTAPGQILGTPAYMSPEQAEGKGHQADRRSDVYSLGVVLYRMLTGRLPFGKTDSLATLLAQIVTQEPPRLRSLCPELPRDLETICLKAMAKAPGDRFPSAKALADELWRWLRDEPLTIRPPTVWERGRRWARRHRAVARTLTGAAVLLVGVSAVLGGALWRQHEQGHRAELRAVEEHERAERARELQRVEAEKRAEIEAWAYLRRARQRLAVPTLGRRLETHDLLHKAARSRRQLTTGPATESLDRELRSVYATSLGVPDLKMTPSPELPFVFFQLWPVALQPDGSALVIGTPRGPLRWVRGQPFVMPKGLDPREPRPRLEYSPEGKYLAFAPAAGGLELWNADASVRLATLGPKDAGVVRATTFVGQRLWVCRADGMVNAWSLPHLRAEPGWQVPGLRPVTAARFNADATRLAVGDRDGRVLLLQTGNAAPPRELHTGRFEVQALAWSPDSERVAVGAEDGTIQLWGQDGTPPFQFLSFSPGVAVLNFDPEGRWLLAGARSGTFRMWDVHTGTQLLTGPSAAWNLDQAGTCFGSGDTRTVAFCDLLVPHALQPLSGHRVPVERFAWSRDSRHLATLDSQFELHVWDLGRGVSVRSARMPVGTFFAPNAGVALSDDGAQVAYASGGEKTSELMILDVATGRVLAHWRLPGGFERLTFAGGKFILVRERRGIGTEVREFTADSPAGRPPPVLRLLRPHEPGDESFHDSTLTPDGRFYCWVGPRYPLDRVRVEVWEVGTGRRVKRVSMPQQGDAQSMIARLSPDGQRLWCPRDSEGWMQYDLTDRHPPQRIPSPPPVSSVGGWQAAQSLSREFPGVSVLSVRTGPGQPDWLQFLDGGVLGFSPDGRYLAWADGAGLLNVADLPALRAEIEAFEQSLDAKH